MVARLQRVQVLLEERQQRRLVEVAGEQGRSLSALLRDIVDEYIERRSAAEAGERATRALERLAELRAGIEARDGVYAGDLVAEARAERSSQQERVLAHEGDPCP